jgi:cytochrome c oxidase subunit 3
MTTTNLTKTELSMNPKKFALWLFIVSIVMIFASLTSAFLVRRAEGNWIIYNLPSALWISSFVIILSSASMHWSLLSIRKGVLSNTRIGLLVTLSLGLLFGYSQYMSYGELINQKVFFAFANPGGSFFYVLTGLHAFHILTGLLYVLYTYSKVNATNKQQDKILSVEMCATYWHFLGVLWLYLFVFLFIYH